MSTRDTAADRHLEICVIPGDGIGREVTDAACAVLGAVGRTHGLSFTFAQRPAGLGAYEQTGDPLPEDTVATARALDGVLVGAMDVARLPAGVSQPLNGLRRALEVEASVRRSRVLPAVPAVAAGRQVDMLVVREVTEGLYSGIEYPVGPHDACGVRVVTRAASMGAARIAFEQARLRRGRVTAIHKRGALPVTDGRFLDAVAEVAEQHPDIEYETRNVDACALEMIEDPERFDTILCTNAFGDILSDVAAGLTGGLGLAASGCIGTRWAYFEPVHGTAPDIAGKGIANPLAAILSAGLMLAHLGRVAEARAVEEAVTEVLAAGAPRTADIGGSAGSGEVTDAVCARIAATTR